MAITGSIVNLLGVIWFVHRVRTLERERNFYRGKLEEMTKRINFLEIK